MIGNLLHELSYDNLPNLLDLIENLSLCTRRIENAIKFCFQINHDEQYL